MDQYVKSAVETVKGLLADNDKELKSGIKLHKGLLSSRNKSDFDTKNEF